MIGKMERDPVVQGNNEPSGRLNLNGQKKPQYLIDAIEAEEKAYKIYTEAIDTLPMKAAQIFYSTWAIANRKKHDAYARYNQECANG